MPRLCSGSWSQDPLRCRGVKLLFDQNLSPTLAVVLQTVYPGSAHLHELMLGAAGDKKVWSFAKDNEFVIVSKDADFYELSLIHGAPPKIIWIRLGNCRTEKILQAVRQHTDALQNFNKDPRADAFFIS